jgi:hypothetical protein
MVDNIPHGKVNTLFLDGDFMMHDYNSDFDIQKTFPSWRIGGLRGEYGEIQYYF